MILPIYEIKVIQGEKGPTVWDPVRKKYVALNREEFVRQNLIQWLISEKQVPKGLISVERKVSGSQVLRRYDLTVFNSSGNAVLIAECKAPEIKIDQKTLSQLSIYNRQYDAPFILLTNGKLVLSAQRNMDGNFDQQAEIPDYSEMCDHLNRLNS